MVVFDNTGYCDFCGNKIIKEFPYYSIRQTIICLECRTPVKISLSCNHNFRKNLSADPLQNEIANSIGMEFRLIPSGEFHMGSDSTVAHYSEKPVHEVKISKSFYISIHPVTQEQFKAVMNMNRSVFIGPDSPVDNVGWADCAMFCFSLSEKEGEFYRLPTEAEWEYAARAGTQTEYHWGDEIDTAYCWYRENSKCKTNPVGRILSNPWGLHDMAGNVWEWCHDWYDPAYYLRSPLLDPQGPLSGFFHVMRGGAWNSKKKELRSAHRAWSEADFWTKINEGCFGFRIVREII